MFIMINKSFSEKAFFYKKNPFMCKCFLKKSLCCNKLKPFSFKIFDKYEM